MNYFQVTDGRALIRRISNNESSELGKKINELHSSILDMVATHSRLYNLDYTNANTIIPTLTEAAITMASRLGYTPFEIDCAMRFINENYKKGVDIMYKKWLSLYRDHKFKSQDNYIILCHSSKVLGKGESMPNVGLPTD